MGCIFIFGLFLLGVGISMGREGAYAVVSGMLLLWFVWSLRTGKGHKNPSVQNKIVAQDGNGRYLVEADASHQIKGPRPHVIGNLPAAIVQVKKGLWVVDSAGYRSEGYQDVAWKPIDGNYHIEPRGSTSQDFLADEMNGWEHNYIQGDGE